MRKKKIIKLLAGGAVCALSFAVAAAVPMAKDIASADDYTLEMVGAAIRPDNNYGIRFTAETSAVREDSKYYVMIVPESWLTDTNYLGDCTDGDYYAHLKSKGLQDVDDPATKDVDERDFITMQSTPEQKGDVYEVKGTISKVHFKNTNAKFFGVAYEAKADGTRVYAEKTDKCVRSIAWVAGAALNDESENYDTTMKDKLKATVDDAYDFVTYGEEKGTTLDLSSFKFDYQTGFTLHQDATMELKTVNPVPANLDLPMEWSVSDDNLATVTDGVLTVKGSSGECNVSAQIAGQTASISVYPTPKMAEGVLEDFAGLESKRNITKDVRFNSAYTVGAYTNAGITGATGVGYATMIKANGCMALRFGRTENELKEIMQTLDTLTVRVYVLGTTSATTTVNLRVLGATKNIPVKEWHEITVTRDHILSKVPGNTEAEKIANFATNFCSTGLAETPRLLSAVSMAESINVYVDSVTYAVSTETLLEGFNDASTKYYIPKTGNTGFTAGQPETVGGTYHASKADGAGMTASGVVEGRLLASNKCTSLRLSKTEEELKSIIQTLGTLTLRFMIMKDSGNSGSMDVKVLGVTKAVPVNTWYDFTVTRDEILAATTGDTQDAKNAAFAKNFCLTGEAKTPRMFNISTDVSLSIFMDKVTYTSLNFLEGFDTSDSKQYLTEKTSFAQGYTSTAYSNTAFSGAVGVGYAKMIKGYDRMALRFGKTETELTAIMQDLETLTVRVRVDDANKSNETTTTTVNLKVFGVQKTLNVTTWYEITVTRDQILAKMSGETEAEKIASFASNYCKTGNADKCILTAGLTESIYVYVDRVTYTVKAR